MIAESWPAPFRSADKTLQLSVGDVNISLQSDLDEVLADFASLYHGYARDFVPGKRRIRMEVRAAKRSFLRRKRYVICGDGQELGGYHRREEVLPHLEWGINWRIVAARTDYLQVHSATMARSGQAIVFAGASGSGKSTLAAGLLSRGWGYLSDELALIHPDTLRVHPFPKALCIKSGSFELVERLNLPLWRRGHYVHLKAVKGPVGYINPRQLSPNSIANPGRIRFVIFPQYAAGRRPCLHPLTRGQAAFTLMANALNRHTFGTRATSVLSSIVRDAECFGLDSGPIEDTCDLVESLFSR